MKFFLPYPPDNEIAAFVKDEFICDFVYDADYVLHPRLLRDPQDIKAELTNINKTGKAYKKFILVFVLSDFEGYLPIYNWLIIYRTSACKSKIRQNERIMPYIWESKQETFIPSKIEVKPVIGFCGMVDENRRIILDAFENDDSCETRFIKRHSFWGGKPHDEILISEFWENMYESQFTIASRGAGNFSMRFYQALSIGRIPVLLNSDTMLPFENKINWESTIILKNTIEECILEVKSVFREGDVEKRQKACFDIYHSYLSKTSFIHTMVNDLGTFKGQIQSPIFKWCSKFFNKNVCQ